MTLITCIFVLSLVALLAAITRFGVYRIERAYPPAGQFVDVAGARLHVVDLAAPDENAALPPVLLLHGASGNLEEMRLALADRLRAH